MTRKIFLFELLMIAAALLSTALLYPHLPTQVPFHWNLRMEPDSFGPRWQLYAAGPGLMTAMALLTWMLPWLSPRRFSIDRFWSAYHKVMLLLFCMMAYMDAAMLWAAIGHRFNPGRAIFCGLCFFIALIGNLLGKLRRNFYMGVRTPWTLANERVWNATHRFAAKTLIAGGLAGMSLTLLGLSVLGTLALLTGLLAPVAYSLIYYKQLERRGELLESSSPELGD
jgi:uncharacterized membrane protein